MEIVMPYVSVHIDFDEFDEDDLVQELESRGYRVSKTTDTEALGDLDHVEHLALCGLIADARNEALELVGKAIGRPIH
jgi:hypothetical protein